MRRRINNWGIIILALSLVLTGCQKEKKIEKGIAPLPMSSTGALQIEKVETVEKLEIRSKEDIEKLLGDMTLEEKAGQMLQAERADLKPGDFSQYYIGSVLSEGGSTPSEDTTDINAWLAMIQDFQSQARETPHQIPIIYGIDAVHGHNTLANATIFPHNIALGAANDPLLMKKIGEVTAKEMRATGITWTFAPCMPVARDPRWGRYYESYGESTDITASLASALIEGLQATQVAACAKHYIGDGLTEWGSGRDGKIDRGNVILSEEAIRQTVLPAYKAAIASDVKTIMVSFSSIENIKMHANKYWITDVLKEELGFQGFVVTDYEAIAEIPADSFYEKVVIAANAGIDMFMEPKGWREVHKALVEAVGKGDISEERITDAARRILQVKLDMGLFENPIPKVDAGYEIGNQANREIAREAVRKSLVLLKNEKNILPLKKESKIYVLGPAADHIGVQCGGWTVTWQGGEKTVVGKSILEGFKEIAGDNIITDKKRANEADVVVLVLGEKSHAEFLGDDAQLLLSEPFGLSGNIEAIKKAKTLGKPIVTIMVAGRPRIITDELNDWDGFVMAWLPGSEGSGVADVLFEGNYGFTGKLPMNWPKTSEALPIKDSGNILFEREFGLKY